MPKRKPCTTCHGRGHLRDFLMRPEKACPDCLKKKVVRKRISKKASEAKPTK